MVLPPINLQERTGAPFLEECSFIQAPATGLFVPEPYGRRWASDQVDSISPLWDLPAPTRWAGHRGEQTVPPLLWQGGRRTESLMVLVGPTTWEGVEKRDFLSPRSGSGFVF